MTKLLPHNVGSLDRALRVVLGLGLLSLTAFGPHTLWGLVGIVPLATAAMGSCPAYTIFGATTCSAGSRKAQNLAG